MSDPLFTIPAERLPPGFAESIDSQVGKPADPKPAATVVLSRNGAQGLEVLLLKRHRSSGFVPGAYVFPGGRTDAGDADASLAARFPPPERGNVAAEYWFGAIREVFEETGVLIATTKDGWAADASSDEDMETLRLKLMAGEAELKDVVDSLDAKIEFENVVYFAHWITPVAEPRRYDTRFFIAALPDNRIAKADEREMVDAVWLTPRTALERFQKGELPMVFPTVKTLQDLCEFDSIEAALDALRVREVPPIQPRLVRINDGVGIVIDS